ncbi:MAG: ABC transporter permease subunit [Acidobacteriota bacterium]
MSCISLSLLVGLTATVASLAPAIAIALFLERSGSRLRGPVPAILIMPLVLPPVVVGYLLLRLFSPRGIVGGALARIGTPVAFHWLGAVVAAAVVGFPLLVLQISLAVKGVEPNLERLSRSLGRGRLSTFLRVTLPLSWPGILAGFAIAFARGLGEFGATIVLAGRIPARPRRSARRLRGARQPRWRGTRPAPGDRLDDHLRGLRGDRARPRPLAPRRLELQR